MRFVSFCFVASILCFSTCGNPLFAQNSSPNQGSSAPSSPPVAGGQGSQGSSQPTNAVGVVPTINLTVPPPNLTVPSSITIKSDNSDDPVFLRYSPLIAAGTAILAALVTVWGMWGQTKQLAKANLDSQQRQFDAEVRRVKESEDTERRAVSKAIYSELLFYKIISNKIRELLSANETIQLPGGVALPRDELIFVTMRDSIKNPIVFEAFVGRIDCLGPELASETIKFYNGIYIILNTTKVLRENEPKGAPIKNAVPTPQVMNFHAMKFVLIEEGKNFPGQLNEVMEKFEKQLG